MVIKLELEILLPHILAELTLVVINKTLADKLPCAKIEPLVILEVLIEPLDKEVVTKLLTVEKLQNKEPAEISDELLIIFTVPPPPELVNNILPVLSAEILLLVFNTIPFIVFTYKLSEYRFELDTVVPIKLIKFALPELILVLTKLGIVLVVLTKLVELILVHHKLGIVLVVLTKLIKLALAEHKLDIVLDVLTKLVELILVHTKLEIVEYPQ